MNSVMGEFMCGCFLGGHTTELLLEKVQGYFVQIFRGISLPAPRHPFQLRVTVGQVYFHSIFTLEVVRYTRVMLEQTSATFNSLRGRRKCLLHPRPFRVFFDINFPDCNRSINRFISTFLSLDHVDYIFDFLIIDFRVLKIYRITRFLTKFEC